MSPLIEKKLLELAQVLSGRPGMILGNDVSLQSLDHYLGGYFAALFDLGEFQSVRLWSIWIQLNHRKWEPRYSWWEILIEEYGSEEAVFKEFYTLMEDFINQLKEGGEAELINQYDSNGA